MEYSRRWLTPGWLPISLKNSAFGNSTLLPTVPYGRKLYDVALSRTVSSDGCRVFGRHWLRTVFGRGGLIEPTTHAQYKTTVP